MSITLPAPATCGACAFTTTDVALLSNHSCDVALNGGSCEDYPACGHERGDCNGERYGSDAAIQERYMREMRDADEYGDLQDWDY